MRCAGSCGQALAAKVCVPIAVGEHGPEVMSYYCSSCAVARGIGTSLWELLEEIHQRRAEADVKRALRREGFIARGR